MELDQSPDGHFLLSSMQKKADGTPRFMMSLPAGFSSDPGLEILARLETQHAGFEYTTRTFFDAHLEPGDIFLDIGAHFGIYSLGAASLHPGQVRVLAFEPHPVNVLSLVRQLAQNAMQNDVEVVCAAAGREAGFGKLWPYSTMGNFVSAERPADAPSDNPPLTVPVLPIDALFADRPDLAAGRVFLKIDVEGFEPEVVAGAHDLLASGRVAAIALERSDFYAAPARAAAFDGMIAALEQFGYSIYWFPHIHMPCALMPWTQGNEAGNVLALADGFNLQLSYDGPYAPYCNLPPPVSEDFSAADQAALTARLMRNKGTDGWRWVNPRNLDDGAETRARLAVPHIPDKCRVLDLGAGLMQVALQLRNRAVYTPVDLIRYAQATVVVDFNQAQFPDGEWDCALTLELLEHLHDVPAFLRRIRANSIRLIGTYKCTEENPNVEVRRELGFFNDYSRNELESLLKDAAWQITTLETTQRHTLFVCE